MVQSLLITYWFVLYVYCTIKVDFPKFHPLRSAVSAFHTRQFNTLKDKMAQLHSVVKSQLEKADVNNPILTLSGTVKRKHFRYHIETLTFTLIREDGTASTAELPPEEIDKAMRFLR